MEKLSRQGTEIYKTAEKKFEDNITKLCDADGNCNGCTQCCSIYSPITKEELHFLKRKVTKKMKKEFVEKIKKGTIDITCPFSTGKGCSIYNNRPFVCKEFICDFSKINILQMAKTAAMKYKIIDMFSPELSEFVKVFKENQDYFEIQSGGSDWK